ncbi:hypothetical protein GGR55DRAFT_680146 [Xylaria sp. FL0064]|nr:hypothetical protein GGR55DRAFT_680146 [Xylaria sp. FL0064]
MSRKSRARARARRAEKQVEYDTGYTITTITGHVTPPVATATPTINAVNHNSVGAAAGGNSNGNGNGHINNNNNYSRFNNNLNHSHHSNHNGESAATIGNSDGKISSNNKTANPSHNHHHHHPNPHNYNQNHNISGITNGNNSLPKYILPSLAKYSDDEDDDDDGQKNRLADLAPRGSSILGGVPDISNGQRPPERDVGAVGQVLTIGQRWVDIKKLEEWVWVPSKGRYIPRRELREKGEEHLASSVRIFLAPPEVPGRLLQASDHFVPPSWPSTLALLAEALLPVKEEIEEIRARLLAQSAGVEKEQDEEAEGE